MKDKDRGWWERPSPEAFWEDLDEATQRHSMRVSELSVIFAKELGITDQDELELIKEAGKWHDIGKRKEHAKKLPDFNSSIVFTPEERSAMRTLHCDLGRDDLGHNQLNMPFPVVMTATLHHSIGSNLFKLQTERVRNIISIVAASDIYDAMLGEKRSYHEGRMKSEFKHEGKKEFDFEDVCDEWKARNLESFMNTERIKAFQRAIPQATKPG